MAPVDRGVRSTQASNTASAVEYQPRFIIMAKTAIKSLVPNATAQTLKSEHPAELNKGPAQEHETKDQTSVIVKVVQADSKTVPLTDTTLTKEDEAYARSVAAKFGKDNTSYVSLKEKLDEAKGGLSTIMLGLAQRAQTRAEDLKHPQYTLAIFDRLSNYAETAAKISMSTKHGGIASDYTVKEAIGPSWQTYKGQIRRVLTANIMPNAFKSGTTFRQAADAPKAERAPRTPAGVNAPSAADIVGDPALDGLVTELMKSVKQAYRRAADKTDAVAEILADAMRDIDALVGQTKGRTVANVEERLATM